MSLLDLVLTPGLVGAELLGAGDAVAGVWEALLPEEQSLLSDAGETRQERFAAGRGCARKAMIALGVEPVPIGQAEGGAPAWPEGVVGSITHTRDRAHAVVARTAVMLRVGIDLEERARMRPGLWGRIATDAEVRELEALPREQALLRGSLLFSAKEAYYKAVHPLRPRWLGFEEVRVTDIEAKSLRVVPMDGDDPQLPVLEGRWAADETHVLVLLSQAVGG